MRVDHVQFYVGDIDAASAEFTEKYGLTRYAAAGRPAGVRSVALGQQDVRFVLVAAGGEDHPAAGFVERHGDGVADIALRVPDARAAFEEAVAKGASVVARPETRDGVTTATIGGFGDITHTFVDRADGVDERLLPGLVPGAAAPAGRFGEIDHFAVCLEAGQLAPTVEFYERALDFEMIFTERIEVGRQAMNSQVVQSRSGAVTLTLIEPDVTRDSGQIDSFLKDNDGPGVQHIALTTTDIVAAVGGLGAAGVEFLRTPGAYYDMLGERLELTKHSVPALRELNVLVDEDHDGQLFQIFARSTHPRNTFFMEVIERMGARTFGSGNIKALYEAVERQQADR
ncbi:4-hydroxyphenylpyruvate dioxygenase [Kutzneria sp. CA-103260]|uniref:4-hydroxyphenylpyruvate dioxygenase n=1 Tax=Kutzneria sp. CA-103260 TaxID=2802641 RepID=UPI001BA9C089|nr:4-hydroxyphenylpyruvate dioxygenase [Kutzneria sp. CA-103260]QUQ67054.1 4-hydroxyphenylpyruvate dioxygenase [Kutzneria sp. CA-103260]